MKQKLLLLLAAIAFLLPARVSAFEYGGLYYEQRWGDDENGNYTCLGVCVSTSPEDNRYSGDVVIPSTVE